MSHHFFAFVLSALVLTGCAAGSSKTFGPDGREIFVLNCSGWARNWGMCLEKAGELCGTRGYEVVSRDEQSSLMSMGGGVTPVQHRTMSVRCND